MSGADWWAPYEAVVFDLDGTLLRLDVDWGSVEAEVGSVLADAGLDPEDYSAWGLLDAAETVGLGDAVDSLIADHEFEGAQNCTRLPLADIVGEIDRPLGVVSLNSTEAVREALRREGLLDSMAVVIGRGSVPTRKPRPEPLLAALAELHVEPENAVFVGDSDGDETTARRAGADFLWVESVRPETR